MMKHLNRKISQWHKADLYRQRVAVTSRDETYLYYNRKAYVNFSSNDYLGLAKHPIIISVMQEGVQRYGFGSASSCMISGFNAEQLAFEEQFADWLNVESVVLFNSGYMANLGVVSALAERHSVILSDRFCHASMLDGVKISRAKHYRYQHNNIKDLERLAIKYSPNIILTESIFSMEGSAAPVIDIAELAANYQSQLIIDDAHGVGVLGKLGGGVIEHFQLHPDQFLAISLSLGKSFLYTVTLIITSWYFLLSCIVFWFVR